MSWDKNQHNLQKEFVVAHWLDHFSGPVHFPSCFGNKHVPRYENYLSVSESGMKPQKKSDTGLWKIQLIRNFCTETYNLGSRKVGRALNSIEKEKDPCVKPNKVESRPNIIHMDFLKNYWYTQHHLGNHQRSSCQHNILGCWRTLSLHFKMSAIITWGQKWWLWSRWRQAC